MKKYGKFAALIVVVIGTLVWLATAGMKDNQTYYKTITELGQMGAQGLQRACPRGGRRGSRLHPARRQPGSSSCWRRTTTRLKVAYTGHRPAAGHLQGRRPGAGRRQTGQGRRLPRRQRSRPSARPSMKPNRDNSQPGQTAPNINYGQSKHLEGDMENLGSLAILLAFCVALYATAACVVGRLKHKPFLLVSGERAVYGIWVLIATASGILVYSLMTGDFRFAYVAEHTNRAMPMLYKFAAWWGGQEGSLLFWSWLLSTYAAVVVFTNRRRHRDMMPWVIAVLTTIQILLPGAQQLRRQPVPDAGGGQADHVGAGRQRPEPAAAISGHGDPSADAVPGLRGIRGAVRLRHRLADHAAAGRCAGSTPRAAGRWSPGCSRAPASCWARRGLITCSAGAATGAGTRWRTLPCSPGSAARRFCTR